MKKVAILVGGISTEKEVSIKTGTQIFNSIDREKFQPILFEINKKEDIFKIKDLDVDFVYIALHGEFGEDGYTQAVLETYNIPFSGSKMLASSICMDKDLTKIICKNAGVRVINSKVIKKGQKYSYNDYISLGNKLVVKPSNGGSSIGLYIVDNENDFNMAVSNNLKLCNEVIIEEYIKGIEISVPIIDNKVYPAVKITPLLSDTFDYNSKYLDNGAKEEVVEFDDEIQDQINKFTKLAFNSTKCFGFARIDYLIKDNKLYMLEINTLPGMTKNSILPRSLNKLGISYKDTITLLIESSLKC